MAKSFVIAAKDPLKAEEHANQLSKEHKKQDLPIFVKRTGERIIRRPKFKKDPPRNVEPDKN